MIRPDPLSTSVFTAKLYKREYGVYRGKFNQVARFVANVFFDCIKWDIAREKGLTVFYLNKYTKQEE